MGQLLWKAKYQLPSNDEYECHRLENQNATHSSEMSFSRLMDAIISSIENATSIEETLSSLPQSLLQSATQLCASSCSDTLDSDIRHIATFTTGEMISITERFFENECEFESEATRLTRILTSSANAHPNILTLYGVLAFQNVSMFTSHYTLICVSEAYPFTLADLSSKTPLSLSPEQFSLTENTFLEFLRATVSSLAALQREDIAYGALRSTSICFKSDGSIKLAHPQISPNASNFAMHLALESQVQSDAIGGYLSPIEATCIQRNPVLELEHNPIKSSVFVAALVLLRIANSTQKISPTTPSSASGINSSSSIHNNNNNRNNIGEGNAQITTNIDDFFKPFHHIRINSLRVHVTHLDYSQFTIQLLLSMLVEAESIRPDFIQLESALASMHSQSQHSINDTEDSMYPTTKSEIEQIQQNYCDNGEEQNKNSSMTDRISKENTNNLHQQNQQLFHANRSTLKKLKTLTKNCHEGIFPSQFNKEFVKGSPNAQFEGYSQRYLRQSSKQQQQKSSSKQLQQLNSQQQKQQEQSTNASSNILSSEIHNHTGQLLGNNRDSTRSTKTFLRTFDDMTMLGSPQSYLLEPCDLSSGVHYQQQQQQQRSMTEKGNRRCRFFAGNAILRRENRSNMSLHNKYNANANSSSSQVSINLKRSASEKAAVGKSRESAVSHGAALVVAPSEAVAAASQCSIEQSRLKALIMMQHQNDHRKIGSVTRIRTESSEMNEETSVSMQEKVQRQLNRSSLSKSPMNIHLNPVNNRQPKLILNANPQINQIQHQLQQQKSQESLLNVNVAMVINPKGSNSQIQATTGRQNSWIRKEGQTSKYQNTQSEVFVVHQQQEQQKPVFMKGALLVNNNNLGGSSGLRESINRLIQKSNQPPKENNNQAANSSPVPAEGSGGFFHFNEKSNPKKCNKSVTKKQVTTQVQKVNAIVVQNSTTSKSGGKLARIAATSPSLPFGKENQQKGIRKQTRV